MGFWGFGCQKRLRRQGVQKRGHRPARLLLEGFQHSILDLHKIALVPRHLPPQVQQISDSVHLHQASQGHYDAQAQG